MSDTQLPLSIQQEVEEAHAEQIERSLRRISKEADELAETFGVPREEKYELWSALHEGDLNIFQDPTGDDSSVHEGETPLS